MDEWLGGRKGKWGWLLERAGWRAGRALLGTRRHGSACFEPSPPLLQRRTKLKHHVRCTLCSAPMCTLLRSAKVCIVGASVRVEGGHYTNHRGDTLGASPKTRERETGMKNFEMN